MIPKNKIADRIFDNYYLRVANKNRTTSIKRLPEDSKIIKQFKSLNRRALRQIWRNNFMIKVYACPLYSWWQKNGLIIQYFVIGFVLTVMTIFTIYRIIKGLK